MQQSPKSPYHSNKFDYSLMGLMIKLSLIIFLVIVLNQPRYLNVVNADLLIEQISEDVNCDIITSHAESRQNITVNGHQSQVCSLQMLATNDSATLIQVPRNHSETEFLYIESQDVECTGDRYVLIGKLNLESGPCSVVLYDRSFKLNVQGKVDILVQDIPIPSDQQHSLKQNGVNIVDATNTFSKSPICSVTHYNDVYECNHLRNGRCYFNFPPNCTTTLGFREVTFNCLDSYQNPEIINSLMFYSDNLAQLDLHDEHIVDIYANAFKGLDRLTRLNMKTNLMQSVPGGLFDDSEKLRYLSLQFNQLTTIPENLFNRLARLEILYLSSNQLTSLPPTIFLNMRRIDRIKLGNNNLETLDSGIFRGLYLLSDLDLSRNWLMTLPTDVFKGLYSLKTLLLQNNNLNDIGSSIFLDLTNLTTLSLAFNELTYVNVDLFQTNTILNFLDLSDNNLHTIPKITNLVHLHHLHLEDNVLQKVTLMDLSALRQPSEVIVSQPEICQCYTPVGVNCSANQPQSPYLTCERLLSDRVLVIIMWLLGVGAIGGNVFVLWWRNTHTTKYKVQSRLILNLAFSDFLMGVYMVIIASADIHFGENFPIQAEYWRTGITCRIAGVLSVVSSEASVFFVTLISIDRLICIKYPYSACRFGKKSITVAALLIWVFTGALGMVPAILSSTNPNVYDNSHVCIGIPLALVTSYTTHYFEKAIIINKGFRVKKRFIITQVIGSEPGMYFSTAIFIGLNSLCYVVILVCYIMILKTIYKISKAQGLNQEMKDQLRLTGKVTAIVATDLLCWCPIIVLGILVQTEVLTLPPYAFAWAVTFILPLNSAINPYIYTIMDIMNNRGKKTDQKTTSPLTEVTEQTPKLGLNISEPRSMQLSAASPNTEPEQELVIFPDVHDTYGSADTNNVKIS